MIAVPFSFQSAALQLGAEGNESRMAPLVSSPGVGLTSEDLALGPGGQERGGSPAEGRVGRTPQLTRLLRTELSFLKAASLCPPCAGNQQMALSFSPAAAVPTALLGTAVEEQ